MNRNDHKVVALDQAKIGVFIAELRRERNLTQAELGELLGVGNKTVSRWECGNYMPDLAIIPQLAAELGITVNELFAAQRFAEEDYKRNADQQLLKTMQLVEEVRQAKDCRAVTKWIYEAGFTLVGAIISYDLLRPDMERLGNLLIYAFFLACFGGVGLLLKSNGWLRKQSQILLRAVLDVLLIDCCWYALAHQEYMLIPILLIGLCLLWLGGLGDKLYYKTIDKLLKNTEHNLK